MTEENLLKLAMPYLLAGTNKDMVLHTGCVLAAAKDIMKLSGKGNPDIVIPCVIFHDTGWSNVPANMQGETTYELKGQGMRLHQDEGAKIAKNVLSSTEYSDEEVAEIARIISLHKYSEPAPDDIDLHIMKDADNLSDVYQEQFASDLISYTRTPDYLLNYRIRHNDFFMPETKEIFDRLILDRKAEYGVE
jgi:hypothetical protein